MKRKKTIRCMVIDDSPGDRELLAAYIAKMPQLQLVASHGDAFQARDRLAAGDIDLLFLDMEMPGLSGPELLDTLEKPLAVIFCTAFDRYALYGYEVDALGFLLKPIPFKRFSQTVLRACRALGIVAVQAQEGPSLKERRIILRRNKSQAVRVMVLDISFIEVSGNYCRVYLVTNKQCVEVEKSMRGILKQLEEENLAGYFVRIDRGVVVFAESMVEINKNRLTMAGWEEKPLAIAEAHKEEVKRYFSDSLGSADKEV